MLCIAFYTYLRPLVLTIQFLIVLSFSRSLTAASYVRLLKCPGFVLRLTFGVLVALLLSCSHVSPHTMISSPCQHFSGLSRFLSFSLVFITWCLFWYYPFGTCDEFVQNKKFLLINLSIKQGFFITYFHKILMYQKHFIHDANLERFFKFDDLPTDRQLFIY